MDQHWFFFFFCWWETLWCSESCVISGTNVRCFAYSSHGRSSFRVKVPFASCGVASASKSLMSWRKKKQKTKLTTSENCWRLLGVFVKVRPRNNERTSRAKAPEEAAAVILQDKDCVKQCQTVCFCSLLSHLYSFHFLGIGSFTDGPAYFKRVQFIQGIILALLLLRLHATTTSLTEYKSVAAGEFTNWGGQRDYIIFFYVTQII